MAAGIAQYIIDNKLKGMSTEECLARLSPFEDALAEGYNDALKKAEFMFHLSRDSEGKFSLRKNNDVDDLTYGLDKLKIES